MNSQLSHSFIYKNECLLHPFQYKCRHLIKNKNEAFPDTKIIANQSTDLEVKMNGIVKLLPSPFPPCYKENNEENGSTVEWRHKCKLESNTS